MSIIDKIIEKLKEDGSLEVTSDTTFDEFKDWEKILKPWIEEEEKKGTILVRPLDYVDFIDKAISEKCEKIEESETDFPATWEGYSKVELYYCKEPNIFIVRELHNDSDFTGVKYTVHKSVESAVRDYNGTIDSWIDTLLDHSRLEVRGAEESEERAKELEHEKISVEEIKKKVKPIFCVETGRGTKGSVFVCDTPRGSIVLKALKTREPYKWDIFSEHPIGRYKTIIYARNRRELRKKIEEWLERILE